MNVLNTFDLTFQSSIDIWLICFVQCFHLCSPMYSRQAHLERKRNVIGEWQISALYFVTCMRHIGANSNCGSAYFPRPETGIFQIFISEWEKFLQIGPQSPSDNFSSQMNIDTFCLLHRRTFGLINTRLWSCLTLKNKEVSVINLLQVRCSMMIISLHKTGQLRKWS